LTSPLTPLHQVERGIKEEEIFLFLPCPPSPLGGEGARG